MKHEENCELFCQKLILRKDPYKKSLKPTNHVSRIIKIIIAEICNFEKVLWFYEILFQNKYMASEYPLSGAQKEW